MNLKQAIRNWLLPEAGPIARNEIAPPLATASDTCGPESGPGSIRIYINRASNGHTLQVLTYKPNPRGPDWTGELWVVPHGDDLMTVIKAGLIAARLETQ